jgi:phage baseplate assembly protein W
MRVGLNRRTGEVLTGWDHCVQSIAFIIMTRIASLIMLRGFGSTVQDAQDRNATPRRIMTIYTAVAAALRAWEPGFRLRTIQLTRAGADGVFVFQITGIFYPNGHVGDYSVSEERETSLAANGNGIVTVVAA